MTERACLVVVAAIITMVSLVAVAGHGPFAGHVLLALTANHGIDEGDVPVALAWLVAMCCLVAVWRRLPR